MEEYKDEGVFAIFEDDILCLSSNAQKELDWSMSELPDDWDALWLGANLQKPLDRFSDRLFRLKGGWTTHAIIWNNHNGVIDYILEKREDIKKIDVFFADIIQEKFNCFVVWPMLVTQSQWSSDVCKRTDASVILNNFNKHAK
jgi:hypothetical protein